MARKTTKTTKPSDAQIASAVESIKDLVGTNLRDKVAAAMDGYRTLSKVETRDDAIAQRCKVSPAQISRIALLVTLTDGGVIDGRSKTKIAATLEVRGNGSRNRDLDGLTAIYQALNAGDGTGKALRTFATKLATDGTTVTGATYLDEALQHAGAVSGARRHSEARKTKRQRGGAGPEVTPKMVLSHLNRLAGGSKDQQADSDALIVAALTVLDEAGVDLDDVVTAIGEVSEAA